MRLAITLGLFACTFGQLPAQAASFQIQGSACVPADGPPLNLTHTGLPVIGQSFEVNHTTWGGLVALAIGFGPTPPPVTIPQLLFPSQPAGCQIYVDPQVVEAPNGTNKFTVPVPNNPGLQNMSFSMQWYGVAFQCPPPGSGGGGGGGGGGLGCLPFTAPISMIVTSEAGIGTIGT